MAMYIVFYDSTIPKTVERELKWHINHHSSQKIEPENHPIQLNPDNKVANLKLIQADGHELEYAFKILGRDSYPEYPGRVVKFYGDDMRMIYKNL